MIATAKRDVADPISKSREPRAESREPRAESREPRAESREPRAESREPRAESREPRAESESREPRAESREPSCVRRPGDALRQPPHSWRAPDMGRASTARRERPSRHLESRPRPETGPDAPCASSPPSFVRRLTAWAGLAAACLLVACAGLFAAPPAHAQTHDLPWSTTMTVGEATWGGVGYFDGDGDSDNAYGSLDDTDLMSTRIHDRRFHLLGGCRPAGLWHLP